MRAKSRIALLMAVVALTIMMCPTLAFADLQAGSFGNEGVPNGEQNAHSGNLTAGNPDVAAGKLHAQAGGSAATATTIDLNKTTSDYLTTNREEDWFKITLSKPGRLDIVFDSEYGDDADKGWDVYLYDSEQSEIWAGVFVQGGTKARTLTVQGLPAGSFYIMVKTGRWVESFGTPYWTSAEYKLTPKFTASSAWEGELNGRAMLANAISPNATVSGTMSDNDDEDWLKLTLAEPGRLDVVFDSDYGDDSKYGWNVYLYDSEQAEIWSGSFKQGGTKARTLTIQGLPAGTFYIVVSTGKWMSDFGSCYWPGAATVYNLTPKFTASSEWEAELNGRASLASGISLNSTKQGTMRNDDDEDWFKLTLSKAGRVDLVFDSDYSDVANNGWNVYLYDSEQTELWKGKFSQGGTEAKTLASPTLPAGTYYIKVKTGEWMEGYVEWPGAATVYKLTLRLFTQSNNNASQNEQQEGDSSQESNASSNSGTSSNSGASTNTEVKTAPTQWKRLSGDMALDTMQAIVREAFSETGGTVVVATFNGYWDALAAAGLAGLCGAPVLMTDESALSNQTLSELKRLAPSRVFVCGGPAAVSDGACAQIAAACGVEPQRIYGDNAVATAAQINLSSPDATNGDWSGEAFLCTSNGYWDALAAAPVAYALHMPIFLTEPDGTLAASTLAAIRDCGITKVHIAGGTAAVMPSVDGMLGNLLGERFAGATAVETSELVANFGLSRGMSANQLGVATTNGYWDALAGAALCGKKGSVLVLVNDENSSSIDGFVAANAKSELTAYVFGGPAAVSDEVLAKLEGATLVY